MGRLTTFTEEIAFEICDKVAQGAPIINVLDSDARYPSFNTFCRWKQLSSELRDRYAQAMRDRSDRMDSEIQRYIDMCESGKLDAMTARVLIDTLKWRAAKLYPRQWGDNARLALTADEGSQVISVEIKGSEKTQG